MMGLKVSPGALHPRRIVMRSTGAGRRIVIRPSASGGSGGGVTDHGALTGLGDDDHPQYALADGTRGAFATTAQGDLADTAVQPSALSDAITAHTAATDPHGDRAYTDAQIIASLANFVAGAPGILDTWLEMVTAIQADQTGLAALTTVVAGKLAKASNLSDLADIPTARTNLGLGSVDNTADSAKTLAATQITTGTIDTDRLPDVPYTVKLAPAAAFGALGATVGESVHGTIWAGTNFAVNASQYVLARSKVRGIAERFGFWFISATAAPGDTFYVVCYAPNANGMPGALLWSVGVLVSGLSVGANVLSGLTHPIPAGAYVGVKNGSTTGAVTLRGAGLSATHSPLADISGNYNAITATAAGPPAPTAPSGFGLAQNFPSMIVRGV